MSDVINFLIVSVLSIGLLEYTLNFLTKYAKKKFQWLINYEDEIPIFEKKKLNKFFKESFDPELGWIRKSNTSGIEFNYKGSSRFKISKSGSRSNPRNKFKSTKIATFGDSFTFCRQVNDHQTWQSHLAKGLKTNVLNFGVGNYGLDQSILYLERIYKKQTFKISIMGIVPETILRVNSYWKHYYEYNNLFSFKPRFIVKRNKLIKLKNKINNRKKYLKIKKFIPYIRKNDFFYSTVFKKECLRRPYVYSYLKSFKRNGVLLMGILLLGIFSKLRIFKNFRSILNDYFVLKKNNKISNRLYNLRENRLLLNLLFEKYLSFCRKKKSIPIIVVLPQIHDLNMGFKEKKTSYDLFFKELLKKNHVIDMTDIFLKKRNFKKYYINDKYGGHLNNRGNKIVSSQIINYISRHKIL